MQKAQSDVSKEHRRSFSVPKIDKDDIANDNFTIGPSLNERNAEIETPKDEISSLSNVVSHTLNKLLRWSPKPMHRRRSEAGNSQDSTGSDYSVSSEMNGESPGGKSYSPSYSKRASCPTFHADETDERLKVISTAKEGNGLEREIILEQSSNDDLGITMTAPDKVEESSKFTLGEHRRSASSGKEDASPIKRTSSLKINKSESKSDSASRSSAEHLHLSHMHSRERSFEKSLDNIIDKCSSDKSLDAGLGQENSSKNGVISDTNKTDDQSSKKKKKSGPWYTMWNTSYKSRSEEFKKLFREIPHDERLIVDYSCALQKDILVHGRMFISQNWLCFYANIFRWETTLTIPMKKITAVTKERTARVIPNAIQVAMEKEKYFFTSFGARDKTYLMLFRIWQNALLDQPMSPKELWQWVHLSYGDELGLTSSDDDYIAPSQEEEDPTGEEGNSVSKDLEASSLLSTGSEVMANQDILFEDDQEGAAVDTIPTDLSDTTESEAEEFLCAADHTHLAKEPLNCIYNVPVDQLFSMLFGDGKSDLLKRTHAQKNNQNVRITNWEDDPSDGNKHRTVSYLLALNYSIGPKSSETVEQQTLYKVSEPGKFYLIDSESSMAGIPYGDSFNVLNRFCLTRFGKNKCRFRLTTEVKYKKSVWRVTKNLIEKNSLHGCTDFFSTLDSHLKHEKVQETTDILHTHAMSLKRKVRKRRVRTGPSVVDTGLHKGTKPSMARHLSLMDRKQNVTSSSHAFLPTEEKASKMNVQLLTRIIFVTLIFLVIFNAILFYKLWYLETLTSNIYTPLRDDPAQDSSRSPEEWTRLLKQQQYLHEQEIDKWKEILSSSITLIDQMKSTLSQLRDSLDQRYHAQTKYTDSSS